jgi:ribonuclease J
LGLRPANRGKKDFTHNVPKLIAVVCVVKLAFYGGVGEIGGNKILLEDNGTRVFFDFGQSFGFGMDYFTGWLLPRAVNGLGDYFEFGLLPKIKGLYSKELLASTRLAYVKPEFDAVFLSHAHFDHVHHIQFLDPIIPVCLGAGTKLFLECMEVTSSSCDYGEHRYRTFRTGDKIKVGDMVVEPVHVDHSIPAAYGFLIHTLEGAVVYTGDLRVHGPRRDMTEEFAAKAQECEPEALICEGTRMVKAEKRKNYSEPEVESLSAEIASSTRKAVFATHYSRDMDRFRSFYNVAKKSGRRIVVPPKTAYLLSRLTEDKRLSFPDPLKDESVLVYYKRKKSGKFDDRDYYVWERGFMNKMVGHDFVRNNQHELIMDLDFNQFTELVDIRPERGGHFIHSMSEPLSEEDIEEAVMHNWLDHFGLRFHQLHASGHLNRDQLTALIRRIRPKSVFPVHTENPRLFMKVSRNVRMVQAGKVCTL